MKQGKGKAPSNASKNKGNKTENVAHHAQSDTVKPFTNPNDAVLYIQEYQGDVSDFILPICESFYDNDGINTAIILEAIEKKGWTPETLYEKYEGYRIYRFK